MKCSLFNPNDDLEAYWVDWTKMKPLWEENDFHPLHISQLRTAYHELWFKNIDRPRSHFIIGAIDFNNSKGCIMFHNGRHRTILLASLINRVPLALKESVTSVKELKASLIAPLAESDILEIPDLPILTYRELMGEQAHSRGRS